jgi:hypothetical protein
VGHEEQRDVARRALELAGLDGRALDDADGAPTLFAEVRVRLSGEGFALASHEEVALVAVGAESAMEIQLEARALARKWACSWKGGVGPDTVRVAYVAEVPLPEGEPPAVAAAQLQEAMARVHVAHVLLKQRALQIAAAHAKRGGWHP